MRRLTFQSLSTIAVAVSLFVATPAAVMAQADEAGQARAVVRRQIARGAAGQTLLFARTELFFGTAKPDGTAVTDEEFSAFLDEQITPRFPDGLTLLKGDGQFRGEDEVIIKEDSFLLILLYPLQGFKDSSARIESIRELYKSEFQQESVLRVDDPIAVRVWF
jgi:hypothetical protein